MQSAKHSILFLLIIFFISSCSHYAKPNRVPEIAMDVVGSYNQDLSVDLINNQEDTTQQLFWANGGHRFYANYNEWTDFFIKNYNEELKKRGVEVSADSPNKIKVKLSDFAVMQGMFVVRINMKIKLEKEDDRWVKEWTESDTSGGSMGRAFGSAIYHATEKLLKDPEVIEKIKN